MGGPLKRYEVTTPSGAVTTMKLNEDDARRYGLLEAEKPAESPEAESAKPQAKKRAVSNKARAASDKDGGTGGGD